MPKSVIWCWLQELICSCVDVVPSSNNNNNNDSYLSTNDEEMNDNPARVLPNPSAVLKTLAALIAKMEKTTNVKKIKQQLYERETYEPEAMEHEIILSGMQKQQQKLIRKQQQQFTATDTLEQIVMQTNENIQLKSILKKRENCNVSGNLDNNNENLKTGCEMKSEIINNEVEKEEENAYVVRVENTAAKLLQCNKKYVSNNNNNFKPQYHQLINEKSLIVDNSQLKTSFIEDNNQELPLCVNMANDVVDGAQQYKLLQLYANRNNDEYKTPLVTKRIEFFEHSAINTSSSSAEISPTVAVHPKCISSVEKITTPKSSIFSIYRVADLKTGKTTTNAQKIILNTYKKKVAEDETSFIKHDSNVLTALLSCVFIGTFFLLIFFPLSG